MFANHNFELIKSGTSMRIDFCIWRIIQQISFGFQRWGSII